MVLPINKKSRFFKPYPQSGLFIAQNNGVLCKKMSVEVFKSQLRKQRPLDSGTFISVLY